jgi:hypothetical protein
VLLPGLVEGSLELCALRGELGQRRPQGLLGRRELLDDRAVLLREPVEPVEGGEGVVERLGAQKNGQRVDIPFDVELSETHAELAVRGGHV